MLRYSTMPVFYVLYTTDFPLGEPDSPVIRTSPPPAQSAWLRDYPVSLILLCAIF